MPQKPSYKGKYTPGNNPKLVLIGEDDLDDQEFLKEIFYTIDNSLSFLFAPNGSHVLTHLEESDDHQLPCLILLDYNMPGLTGAEILKVLKRNSRYNDIPKIIWSTSQSETFKDICLELGAHDYVVKPSNVNALTEVCRHMLSFCKKED